MDCSEQFGKNIPLLEKSTSKEQLNEVATFVDLPTDSPRFAIKTSDIQKETFSLKQEVLIKLKRDNDDLSEIFLLTLSALLYRYSNQSEIIIGYQGAHKIQPIRINLNGNDSSFDLSEQIKNSILLANQESQETKYTLIFATCDLSSEFKKINFDLRFSIYSIENDIDITLEYNQNLFIQEKIERMITHFQNLIEEILKDSTKEISKLNLLTSEEQQLILRDWNQNKVDYPNDKCIHQLFEQQVVKTPEAIALVFENQSLTYQQLNNRANQLAHYLISLGVKPETLVGICLERSLEMIVGLLGILKAGGAYVPLDPNYPAERLKYMLEDANVEILLSQPNITIETSAQIIYFDEFSQESIENPDVKVNPENLAYVIYTSGSTGKPKGVMIEQRNTVAFIEWARSYFTSGQLNKVLASTSLGFDLSIFEIFVTLCCAGQVILVENAISLNENHQPYLINTVPSAIKTLLEMQAIPKSVKIISLAGEPLPALLVQKLYQVDHIEQVFNLYGPSEDTTYSSVALMSRDSTKKVVIGRPISNSQIYILDFNLQPVLIGVAGELFIGGDGLARGYLNRPELTQEKFIINPFGEGRLYKTGDLGRYLPDGNIEYLGRIDNQVKIRGFRIELGEIESLLNQHPQIEQTVVISTEDSSGDKKLIAYLVTIGQTISKNELRQYLKNKLPEFMVPSFFVILEQFPLTPNGKIDKKALPLPEVERANYKEPSNENEKTIAEIWAQILKLEKVGIDDNFFSIGGHSLLAVELFAQLQSSFDCKLPLSSLFQYPTVRKLSQLIDRQDSYSFSTSLCPIQTSGDKPPLFFINSITQAYLLGEHIAKDQPFYCLNIFGLTDYFKNRPSLLQLEKIASKFIQDMRSVSPEGPYLLITYCADAYLTLEIAQQLQQQGDKVAFVGLIDSLFDSNKLNFTDYWQNFQRFGFDYILEKLKNNLRIFQERTKIKLAKIKANLSTQKDKVLEDYLADVAFYNSFEHIRNTHPLQPYQSKVTFFISSELLPLYSSDLPDTEVQQVPGYHHALFNQPYVEILVEKLQSSIDKLDL